MGSEGHHLTLGSRTDPVLREEMTTLSPTRLRPVEVECLLPGDPLLPGMREAMACDGTRDAEGARVEV